jgi:PHD/YefM family antitoxin component YafN of YafNO toxin-antitoxin module
MKNLSATEVRRRWSRTLGRVEHGGEIVLILRNRRAAAVLMPADGLDLLRALEDAIDVQIARKAMARKRGQRQVKWSTIKRQFGWGPR